MRQDWNLYGFLHQFPSVSMEQGLAEMERHARMTAQRIMRPADAGPPVFERTDVPVKYMFDYLADVRSLKDFHWDYPEVLREHTYDAVVTAGRILELDAYRGVENGVVHGHRGTASGSRILVNSRMSIRIVFDYLPEGKTIKQFHCLFLPIRAEFCHTKPLMSFRVSFCQFERISVIPSLLPSFRAQRGISSVAAGSNFRIFVEGCRFKSMPAEPAPDRYRIP